MRSSVARQTGFGWRLADNSFLRGELAAELNNVGWDWSISVTNFNNKQLVKALIDEDAFWKTLPGNEYEVRYNQLVRKKMHNTWWCDARTS